MFCSSAHWYLAIICFPGLEKPELWPSPPPKQEIMLPTKVDDDEEFDQRIKGAEAVPPAAVPSEEKVSQEAETSPPGKNLVLRKQPLFRGEPYEYKHY